MAPRGLSAGAPPWALSLQNPWRHPQAVGYLGGCGESPGPHRDMLPLVGFSPGQPETRVW